MSWTYKTWSERLLDIPLKDGGSLYVCRTYQVKDKWIPHWHFNEETRLWEQAPGQEYPPTENNNGSNSTATT